jgi:hypothetical protein
VLPPRPSVRDWRHDYLYRQVTDLLELIVRRVVNMETSVVGVERVLEYCDLPSEAPELVEGIFLAFTWSNLLQALLEEVS